jgi:hypothetical protein
MMTRSQMRPIPHIIAIGMSLICIVFERGPHKHRDAPATPEKNE